MKQHLGIDQRRHAISPFHHQTWQRPPAIAFKFWKIMGKFANSDESSHPEGNSAFQTELENIKLQRKVHDYLEN